MSNQRQQLPTLDTYYLRVYALAIKGKAIVVRSDIKPSERVEVRATSLEEALDCQVAHIEHVRNEMAMKDGFTIWERVEGAEVLGIRRGVYAVLAARNPKTLTVETLVMVAASPPIAWN